jgi:hypothetical protein
LDGWLGGSRPGEIAHSVRVKQLILKGKRVTNFGLRGPQLMCGGAQREWLVGQWFAKEMQCIEYYYALFLLIHRQEAGPRKIPTHLFNSNVFI